MSKIIIHNNSASSDRDALLCVSQVLRTNHHANIKADMKDTFFPYLQVKSDFDGTTHTFEVRDIE